MGKAPKERKVSPQQAVKNYLDRKVPRKVATFYRPDLTDRDGKQMTAHPLNKCQHNVTLEGWCQGCGDQYLAGSVAGSSE